VPPSGATVEVTVTPSLGGESSFPAEMFADGTWKVLLPPTEAGGSYTATASCAKCADTNATTIKNLAFGDVWVCSGQVREQHAAYSTRSTPGRSLAGSGQMWAYHVMSCHDVSMVSCVLVHHHYHHDVVSVEHAALALDDL
jgi:hypothetical protein